MAHDSFVPFLAPTRLTTGLDLPDGSDLTWDENETGPIRLRAEDLGVGG
jgi:hypothetical protein